MRMLLTNPKSAHDLILEADLLVSYGKILPKILWDCQRSFMSNFYGLKSYLILSNLDYPSNLAISNEILILD
jgi:hypothetical protein